MPLPSTNAYTPLKNDDVHVTPTYVPPTMNYGSTSQSTSTTDFDEQLCAATKTKASSNGISNSFREFFRRNTGLLLIVAAEGCFGTLMNFSVKSLHGIDPPVSTLQLILVRMGITYVFSMTYMFAAGIPDPVLGPKGVRLLLASRGFFGFLGLFGIYFSLQYLSLSDATVLTFLSPLCTGFAGAMFLGEHLNCRQVIAGLFSLAGVILIARPPFLFGGIIPPQIGGEGLGLLGFQFSPEDPSEKRMLAVLVALIGVIGATGSYTSLRAIGKRAHPLHSLVAFSWQCVLAAIIGMIITEEPFIVPTEIPWLAMLLLVGVFGFVAQILLTMGLARETAGRGTMALYVQIVFATILERVFFHTTPSLLSSIGTSLIVSSAVYVAFMKVESGKSLLSDKDETMERGLIGTDESTS